MNLKERIKIENDNLKRDISSDNKMLSKLPSGSLIIAKKKDKVEWYRSFSKTKKRTYLSKSEIDLAKKLALKGYLKARLRENKEKLRATNAYLRTCNEIAYTEEYLNKNSEIMNLISGKVVGQEKYVSDWLKNTYTGEHPYPDQMTVKTKNGIYVRSKSEQIIAGHLFDRGIPFKYEDRLMMRTHDLFPDFTVMNPHTHEVYIWEHMGMMDDDNYRNNSIRKINDYAKLGFFLGENLIMTFETKGSGIDETLIDFYIEYYFT